MDCYNCQSTQLSTLYSNTDVQDGSTYSYLQCQRCKLVMINPLPSDQRLDQIYSFTDYTMERKINSLLFLLFENPLIKPLFHFYSQRVNKERANYIIKSRNKTGNTILDIGCGAGRFLVEMHTHGWQVIGQEISKKCLNETRDALGDHVKLTNQPIEQITEIAEADVITLWHVFEHIKEFQSLISIITHKMKTGAELIIETPNADSLSMKVFKTASPMILTPQHITFWTPAAYEYLATSCNLQINDISFPRTFLFTTLTAAYKAFTQRINNNILAFLLALCVFPVSLIVYICIPKYNESIRVRLIKV